jgi:hypothetical protein
VNLDPLEERLRRAPAGQLIAHLAARNRFAGDEMPLDVLRVQIIEHQRPAAGERGGDVANDGRVIASVFEVSEAGEQVEDEIECVRAERLPHVLLDIANGRIVVRSSACEAAGRHVDAGDAEATGSEASRMPAAAAAEIEHARTASGLESIDQPIDKGASFGLVAA